MSTFVLIILTGCSFGVTSLNVPGFKTKDACVAASKKIKHDNICFYDVTCLEMK